MKKEIRLIDAHDLWSDIMMLPHNGDMISSEEVEQAIMDATTVDAVPVVHGRWLDNGMCHHKPNRFRNPDKWTVYKCSECGYSNGRRKNVNYCPNCGAKMDGGNGNA